MLKMGKPQPLSSNNKCIDIAKTYIWTISIVIILRQNNTMGQ